MKKTFNARSKVTKILALCLIAAVAVGSFAFFTDRTTADASATAGDINLVWEDTSLKANSNNEFAQDDVWDTASGLVTAGNIINPGDYFDLSYTLTNDGSKSIDVRQRIVLVSSVDMTANAEEYKLTITGGNDTTAVVPVKDGARTLIYDLKDIILVGSHEKNTAVGGEEEGAVTGVYTVRLDFSEAALNAFMDSTVDIDLYATAKQHRNTDVDDFPAFNTLASVTNGTSAETVGNKVVEYIAD